jgi:hypothetical protein
MDQDLVEKWQQLMLEWDAASAAYEEARRAPQTSASLESGAAEGAPAVEAALTRLNEIKRKIDALISEGGSRRAPDPEHLVVGTIELGAEGSTSADGDLPSDQREGAVQKPGRH